MGLKVYKADLRLTVPVVVNGKVLRYVCFQDENNTFSTSDEKLQKALEGLPLYGKAFKLFRSVEAKKPKKPAEKPEAGSAGDNDATTEGLQVFEEVTDWQTAKDVLKGEPYAVPYQALGCPEAILKKAEELRVSFPNLH